MILWRNPLTTVLVWTKVISLYHVDKAVEKYRIRVDSNNSLVFC